MSFTDDLDCIDPNTIENSGPKYVMGHWHNGDPKLKAVGGVAYTGGVFVPSKYLDDDLALAPGWAHVELAFASGNTDQGIASAAPMLAVIRTRFSWFERQGQVTNYYPRSDYRPGLRGKLQALCAVRGYAFPMVITFTGTAGKDFEAHLREFYAKTRDAARRAAKTEFPRFAFYMPVKAGAHVKKGQQGKDSVVTPPTVALDALTADDLAKLYVGRDRLMELQLEYHTANDWVAAWDKGKAQPADELAPDAPEFTDDDPDMQTVGQPHQSSADMLGIDAAWGAGAKKRPTNYSQGR